MTTEERKLVEEAKLEAATDEYYKRKREGEAAASTSFAGAVASPPATAHAPGSGRAQLGRGEAAG